MRPFCVSYAQNGRETTAKPHSPDVKRQRAQASAIKHRTESHTVSLLLQSQLKHAITVACRAGGHIVPQFTWGEGRYCGAACICDGG